MALVSAPAWLIAEREFRAYTTTASFWIALAVGPLVMAGVLAIATLAGAGAGAAPAPVAVAVRASDPSLARSASTALSQAAAIEGRTYAPGAADASASLVVSRKADGGLVARFSGDFPLSPSGRALVARTMERDAALGELAHPGAAALPVQVTADADAKPRPQDTGVLSRFGLVMMLWLTLTGSLGMLLQAVVRERGNRALEGLLAAAQPWEIVVGKVVGVGAVSALVLAAWLVSSAALAAMAPGGAGVVRTVVVALAAPLMLVRAVSLYLLAFGFYGLVTVAVGASARDSASAQNLSRPMFAVLLAAFFAALAAVSGAASQLTWLVYAPPFAPFMLLLEPPGALSVGAQLVAVGLTLAATFAAGRLAVARLTLSGAPDRAVRAT